MAAMDWRIIEDGSLSIGEKTRGISYHPKLNTLLVVTEDSSLQVLDVNTGVILQKSTLCADPGSSVECKYLNEVEQVLFKSDCVVGLRKDISGVLLLDSALQAPVSKTDDFVVVELTHSEAIQLLACLKKVALPGQEYLEEVRDGLQMGIMTCKGAVDHSNHKVAKWATVKINLPHTAISSVCSSLIAVPQNTNKPGLSIASAILDRLDSLYPTNHIPDFTPVSSTRTVDRALMYTEAARMKTFTAWPHMDYKWALPDAMAQAGFYHGPTAPGDDRALCFTCSVCLVCWEPTDEPWSEHERHSPNCPHVRGEHTQNVPLAATLASSPAQIHGNKTNHICCISSSTSKHHIATATTNGNICLWDVTRQLKVCSQFTVALSNEKCKVNSRKSKMAKAKEAFTQDCTQSSVKQKLLEEPSDEKKDSVEKDEGYGTINDLSMTWSNTPPSADNICETFQVTAMHIIDCENALNIEETATNGEESNSVKGCQKDKNFCHIFVGIHASLPEISKELISEENSLSNRTILSVYTTSEKRIEEKKAVKATKSKTSPLESGTLKTGGVSTLSEILIPQIISFDDKEVKYVESPLSIPPVEAVEPVDEPSQDSAMKDDFQCVTQTKCNFSIKLPPHIEDENLFVSSMFSSLDPNSIVVVLSPVNCLPVSKKIDETTKCNIRVKIDQDVSKVNGLAKNHTDKDPPSNFDNVDVNGELCEKISSDDTFENVTYVTPDEVNLGQSTKNENPYGGYILVYTICFDKLGMIENLLLQKCFRIEDPSRSLSNIVLLPGESNGDKTDDTVDASNLYNPDVMKKTATKSIGEDEIDGSVAAENLGQFAALTKEGGVIFMDIGTCDTLAYLPPLPIDAGSAEKKNIDKFAALAYCMGMERVSVCTESGELRFLQLVQGSASDQSPSDDLDCDVNLSNMMLADQDAVFMQSSECLVNQPITAENLKQLTELTKFETLIPRFSATVPPCWTEIQQEQQQRRHPQHLHQRHHGDATQHTRTWKLSTTGANEHLFELVLSKPSVVGHIDVKLNFQHFCDRVPGIQITLLKQTSQHGFSKEPTPVDSLIDFSMDMLFSDTKERKYQENVASSMNMLLGDIEEGAEEKMKSVFLESHKNDIICGPLSLDSVIDVPGCSGLVTLTSHELLQSKYRSFLLHICTSESVKPDVKRCNRSNRKDPPFILTMFQNPPPVTPSEHISAFAFTKDLDKIQGVDWIQEISVTIRKTKRITVLNDRVQRLAMLESSSFHENIVNILIDSKSSGLCGSREFTRSLVLDILCWVAGVQVSEPNRTSSSIVDAVRKEMSNIIRVCFLESGRSVAHRCSQLFMLCIGCTKNRGEQLMAEFHDIMLQGLLQWVPRILNAASAGSLHWFFLLLNLVKSGDLESTSETCASFLNVVSKQLQEKTLPQHALLRAKYGLYGTPLDAVMFDGPAIFLPAKSSTTPSTSSIQQSMNTFAPTLPTTTPHFQQSMVGDGKILAGENGKGNGNGNGELVPAPGGVMMKGILEVEPLHFVCCATSDGTQVKKTGIEGTPVPSLHAGSMNAKESGGSGPVSTLSALSNAMTEHQLQKQKLYPFGLPHMDYPSQSKASSLSYTLQPYVAGPSLYLSPGKSFAQAISQGPAGKNGISSGTSKSPVVGGQNTKSASTVCVQSLIQPPQPHLLVIDRMHSGARRYVTLDFGRPILLTDVFIPSCTELASLSIDLWSQGEEVDGQRLVVSMDISKRDLTMNDLLPPPLCRYVKITVIGRYGRNTVRTKIPIGCFYGHSFVFPWEQEQHVASLLSSAVSSADDSVSVEQYTQSVAMLREDIHCRYRLACDRLEHLLDAAHSTYQSLGQASKKDEKNGMSTKMRKAYMECIQLQNQLNLVQRVVNRLKQLEDDDSQFEMLDKESSIKAASGDQLRVLAEYLVVCLISITSLNPSPPAALLHIMSMESCKALFKDLIMCGTPRVRVSTGALLQRVCQSQAWWGEFLATTLEELFHSEQVEVFPQERVFVLLTLMGHKSIMSGNMGVLEHFLALLAKMLSPLQNTQGYYRSCRGNLDLPLVGWVLLFLSRTLEQATPPAADVPTEEDENGNDVAAAKEAEKKTKRKAGSRWDFINLDLTTTEVPKTQRGTTNQAQCQRLAKQMKMHKEQIKQLESKHKAIQTMLVEEGKDKDPLVLQKVFKEYKQHKSKHSKDLLRIRRLAYQELHSKGEKDSKGDDDASEKPADIFQAQIRLPREQCLPVVQGLTQLLLSMDFTCHVDLFLVACKVLARICNSTRPAITLAEVMTQQQLQQLLMLCVGSKFNCGAASWGGPWASHAIICLLQDILEGELLHPIEEASNQGTHGEERLEIDPDLTNDAAPEIEVAGATGGAEVNDVAGNVFDIMGDTEASDFPPLSSTPDESIMVHPMQQPSFLSDPLDIGYALPDDIDDICFGSSKYYSVWEDGYNAKGPKRTLKAGASSGRILYQSMNGNGNGKGSASGALQNVSLAMDARLELGLQMQAEWYLKISSLTDVSAVSQAQVTDCLPSQSGQSSADSGNTADTNSIDTPFPLMSSTQMLTVCFNQIFGEIQNQRVNLEALLQLWLTLNINATTVLEHKQESKKFNASLVPTIPLLQDSMSNLLACLARQPNTHLQTWCLTFQTLCCLANSRCHDPEETSEAVWMANLMVEDHNLLLALVQFFSGNILQPGDSTIQGQAGPSVVQAVKDFLVRLQMRVSTSPEPHTSTFKSLLLNLLQLMVVEPRGAFQVGTGPLDAQIFLLECILEQEFTTVDVANTVNLIDAIVLLVHSHLSSAQQVTSHSASTSTLSARSCFTGLFASMLRGVEYKSIDGGVGRDDLMCYLLRLVNNLVEIPIDTVEVPISESNVPDNHKSNHPDSENSDLEPMTDSSKINAAQQQLDAPQGASGSSFSAISDEEKQRTGESSEQQVNTTAISDEEKSSASTSSTAPTMTECTKYIADIILSQSRTVTLLLSALSYCDSNTMAMIIGGGLCQLTTESLSTGESVSVGDNIYQVLCTLNTKATVVDLILKNIMSYISGGDRGHLPTVAAPLSEPLLWFILRALSSEKALQAFHNMGGIQVFCRNLVSSNQTVIDTTPSAISSIMQRLGVANKPNGGAVPPSANIPKSRGLTSETETIDGLYNFAPHGSISSSSPTAQPAEVLLQPQAPHRRARSPAWSYHFYPDESWCDLTITLPGAVLIKEIHIQPHLTSLATCPSAVALELSRDGYTSIPISSPISTGGLTYIKLQLQKPEVTRSVCLKLHRPRDSSSIGLSQIMLLGLSAFSNSSANQNPFLLTEDAASKSSVGWLRLLHHCLTYSPSLEPMMSAAASTSTPHLLTTCTALLLSRHSLIRAANIEVVLLKIGLHSTELGLSLFDILLRNLYLTDDDGQTPSLLGRGHGNSSESTVEIIYQLGMTQDQGTKERVQALLEWLGDTARVALHKHSTYQRAPHTLSPLEVGLLAPSPAHIHCVATIIWSSFELPVPYDLRSLLTQELFSSIYEWSMVLPSTCALKKSADYVLCSMCYVQPSFFTSMMEWMGVVHDTSLEMVSHLTDDSKGAEKGAGTDDEQLPRHQPITIEDLGLVILNEDHLTTLSIACRSPSASQQLITSGFLAILTQALVEFCEYEILRNQSDSSSPSPRPAKSPRGTRLKHRTDSVSSDYVSLTADLVAPVLNFFGEVSQEPSMKEWLGGSEGRIFWKALLNLLCNNSSNEYQTQTLPSNRKKSTVLTSQQRSAIENATISFLSKTIACHSENQRKLAEVICDVICSKNDSNGTNLITGFTRRLILQLMLEDEKILVHLKSTRHLYKASGSTPTGLQHPSFGAGHKFRTIEVDLMDSISKVLSQVSDTPSLTSKILDSKTEKLPTSTDKVLFPSLIADLAKSKLKKVAAKLSDAGIKNKATDKYNSESDGKDSSSAFPRPPTRRGRLGLNRDSMSILTLSLHHSMFPNQALPSKLTLGQLMVLLKQRGLDAGFSYLHFTMKLTGKLITTHSAKMNSVDDSSSDNNKSPDDFNDAIPDAVLLDTPALPSFLHVFASMNGLALIAEHLPMLYSETPRPEIATSSSVIEKNADDQIKGEWLPSEMGGGMESGIEENWYHPLQFQYMEETNQGGSTTNNSLPLSSTTTHLGHNIAIPAHSLAAFGLFLRLPGYAEVLLKEHKKAQFLLRLILGVTDDGEGGHILSSPQASCLPTLPFSILITLLHGSPLTTDDGVLLRRMTLDIGALHLVLACMSILSHYAPRVTPPVATSEASSSVNGVGNAAGSENEKSQNYWAKGTGFGTGSTTSGWDVEQALNKQKVEEEHVTCLLQVLSAFINPSGQLESKEGACEGMTEDQLSAVFPPMFVKLLSHSCLLPAISSYLRNDSVLDMARHIPLYCAVLELLRAFSSCPNMVELLLPLPDQDDEVPTTTTCITSLLESLKGCVDTYTSKLQLNKDSKVPRKNIKDFAANSDDPETEGLTLLVPDIQNTVEIVRKATKKYRTSDNTDSANTSTSIPPLLASTPEERYCAIIKKLQFDTYQMVTEDENGKTRFNIPHHYSSSINLSGNVKNPKRARRLAQEAVTISTSLPLSASSSVFVRCDEERLDLMKVLITGPGDTPYANGCFEFDVYFPSDYPTSPMQINLETTGQHSIRFNPNLYNDGKVCLSILNTWHGRPEEKWNPNTSSFLQVLVSIQSLILVSEPYFNEPGYERSRGTPAGTQSSHDYDANIMQATVRWAMLEMVRNPPLVFKNVIQNHFYLKRAEVMAQCEEWVALLTRYCENKRVGKTMAHHLTALKRHTAQLREELKKLKPPKNLEEFEKEDKTKPDETVNKQEEKSTKEIEETKLEEPEEEKHMTFDQSIYDIVESPYVTVENSFPSVLMEAFVNDEEPPFGFDEVDF